MMDLMCVVHDGLKKKCRQNLSKDDCQCFELKRSKHTKRLKKSTYHVTNEEVRAKIQQAIGPHEDLTMVKRRKLQWYGHISRS